SPPPTTRPGVGVVRAPGCGRTWRATGRAFLVSGAAVLAAGCGTAPEEVMTWQEFVDVYVGLRTAELRASDPVIAEARRDSVLAAHGVTEEDLLVFAERYGDNVTFMEGVWGAVENRMVELTSRPDSVG
ncbi:MAG: hypothetical protein OXN18_01555, partial [Gemmatimonadota bacterium]|nr:hypothetical protein [Gemmatimonadota bacterium]